MILRLRELSLFAVMQEMFTWGHYLKIVWTYFTNHCCPPTNSTLHRQTLVKGTT